jgi:hypothetical protein
MPSLKVLQQSLSLGNRVLQCRTFSREAVFSESQIKTHCLRSGALFERKTGWTMWSLDTLRKSKLSVAILSRVTFQDSTPDNPEVNRHCDSFHVLNGSLTRILWSLPLPLGLFQLFAPGMFSRVTLSANSVQRHEHTEGPATWRWPMRLYGATWLLWIEMCETHMDFKDTGHTEKNMKYIIANV